MKTRKQKKLVIKRHFSKTKLVNKDKYIQSGGTVIIDAARLLKGLLKTGKAESQAGKVLQDYIKLSQKTPIPNTEAAKALILQVAHTAGDIKLGHALIESLKRVNLSKVVKELKIENQSLFSLSSLREMDSLRSLQGARASSAWRRSKWKFSKQIKDLKFYKESIHEEKLVLAHVAAGVLFSAGHSLYDKYNKMIESKKEEDSNKSNNELKNLSFPNENIDDTYNLYRLFSFSDENTGFFKVLDTLSKTDIVKSDSLFIEPYFEMAGGARAKSPNTIPIEKSNRHQILNYIRRNHRVVAKLKEVSNFFKQKDNTNLTHGDFVKLATVKRSDNKTLQEYTLEYGCLGKDLQMEKKGSEIILTFSKVGQITKLLHTDTDDETPISCIIVCDGISVEYKQSDLESSYNWNSLKYKIIELQELYHTIATEKYREFFPNNQDDFKINSYVKLQDRILTKKGWFSSVVGESDTGRYKNDGCLQDGAVEEYINETEVRINYQAIGKILKVEEEQDDVASKKYIKYTIQCGDNSSNTREYESRSYNLIPLGFPSTVTYKNEANNDFIDALFKTLSEKPLFIDGKETFDKLWEHYSLRKRTDITPEYTISNLLDKYRNAIKHSILKEEIISTLYENVVLSSKAHLTKGIYINNIFNKNIKQQNSNISKEIHFNINTYFMRDYIYTILSEDNTVEIEELTEFLSVFYSDANISIINKLLNTSIDYFEYDIIKSDDEHFLSIVDSKVGNHSELYRNSIKTYFKEYYFNICRVYQELIKKCNTSSEAATISSSRVLVEFKKIVNILGKFGGHLLADSIKKTLGEIQNDLELINVAT
jgi:hypothetical protein